MKHFETISEINEEKMDKNIFNKLNNEVEDYINSKVNKFVIIIENCNFDFNKAEARLENKITDLKNDLKKKFFSTVFLEEIDDILERKIIKITLEDLAERKLDGTLSYNESLENKYLDIIFNEAKFYIKNDLDLKFDSQSIDYVKKIIKFLNKKNILNKKSQGDLINKILE